MSIDFSSDRWERLRADSALWWAGKLERPMMGQVLHGRDPGRPEPRAPLLSQSTCAALSIPAEDLIDRIDYELSQNVYLGDAFPCFNLDCFGPGVAAAFLGAELDNSTGRVWFHPKKLLPVGELHFTYDPDNVWLRRIIEICEKGVERWQGRVMLGMPDLGGAMDILSTFRPGENLLLDLYDEPDEVARLVGEIDALWHRFYRRIEEALRPVSPGYTDWTGLFSPTPSYVLQDDFTYMISPEMFARFARPALVTDCDRLDHTIYHFDGVGQLSHLDQVLSIGKLDAVQWVPGDGKPGLTEWPEVYRKIHDAGKGIYTWGGNEVLDAVSHQIGGASGIWHIAETRDLSYEKEARARLRLLGVE